MSIEERIRAYSRELEQIKMAALDLRQRREANVHKIMEAQRSRQEARAEYEQARTQQLLMSLNEAKHRREDGSGAKAAPADGDVLDPDVEEYQNLAALIPPDQGGLDVFALFKLEKARQQRFEQPENRRGIAALYNGPVLDAIINAGPGPADTTEAAHSVLLPLPVPPLQDLLLQGRGAAQTEQLQVRLDQLRASRDKILQAVREGEAEEKLRDRAAQLKRDIEHYQEVSVLLGRAGSASHTSAPDDASTSGGSPVTGGVVLQGGAGVAGNPYTLLATPPAGTNVSFTATGEPELRSVHPIDQYQSTIRNDVLQNMMLLDSLENDMMANRNKSYNSSVLK